MPLALYRKYRPGTLAQVVGQEHVTEPIAAALLSGRISHAYLFSGPRGCGKTSSARILARSLNCEQGPTATPCGVCASCVALAPNGPGSLDVIEIDAASHGLIDDARDLRERAYYAPATSRYKVYVIDEAHMVTTGAFNALLKVVEEPPDHLVFVFATTEPDKVLATIRSRTHHYPFRLVPPTVLRAHLAGVCTQEGVEVDPTVLPLVVRAGAGSVRDAMSVLDQLIAGAGPEGLTYARAVALLGFTDAALLDEVVDALAARDGATVFTAVARAVEAGHDPRRFAGDLLERLRDLIVLAAVPDASTSGLFDCPSDQLERMTGQAARFGPAELTRAAELFAAGLTEMRGTTSPRLLLELICARALLPGAAVGESGMLARLDRLERRLDISGARRTPSAPDRDAATAIAAPATPPPPPAPAASAAPAPPPDRAPPVPSPVAPAGSEAAAPAGPVEEAAGGTLDAASLRRVWDDVLEAVKARKRTTWTLLHSYARVAGVEGRTLTLGFSNEPIRRRFDAGVNPAVLAESLREVLGVDWQVETVAGGDGNGGLPPAPTSTTPTGPRGGDRASEGFAPGDAPEPEDPDESTPDPGPTVPGEEAVLALVRDGLGGRVISESSSR